MSDTFSSDVDRFEWLVDTLLTRADQIQYAQVLEPNHLQVLLVATSLIERALSYASAIRTLMKNEQTTGTAPLQRAIYELWIEHTYLLGVGEPWRNAVKAQINAACEALEFVEKRPQCFSFDDLESIRRSLASWLAEYPDLMQEIHTQRQQRRFHWSGMNRGRLEREVMAAHDLYQMLSWEAHAVLSSIRDIEITQHDSAYTLRFEPQNTPTADPEAVSYMVGGMLYNMWNKYAEFFGLPLAELPSDEERKARP